MSKNKVDRRVDLRKIQREQNSWSKKNFGNSPPYRPVLGVCEEAGELAHHQLKMEQGIRGSRAEHLSGMYDSIGDIAVYLLQVCNNHGWDFSDLVSEVWDRVKERNWKKNTKSGTWLPYNP